MIEYLKWSHNVPEITWNANIIYSFHIACWRKITPPVWYLHGSESIEKKKTEGIQLANCAMSNLIKAFFFYVHKLLDSQNYENFPNVFFNLKE